MTNSSEFQTFESPTARQTSDTLGLGKTSGQRGAEILAGFRAEKYPSPDTIALSRMAGRIVARVLTQMLPNPAAMNFILARLRGMDSLIRKSLPADGRDVIIVETACGLSPRGLQLARDFPNSRVIEIDLPDVIHDKQQRLSRAKDVTIPTNIEWRAADLGITPLAQVLDGQLVDVVVAEGLNAYFTPAEISKIAGGVRECLKPGGVYISDIPWETGMNTIKSAVSYFSRQAGQYKGIVKDEAAARQPFLDAGYSSVTLHRATQMAAALNLPEQLADFSFFVVAQKGAA